MRRRSRGTLLVDTLVSIALFTVAMSLSVPIFRWCSLDMHRAQNQTMQAAVFDQAMDVLRRDTWQARKVDRPAPDRLVLTGADGPITWQIAGKQMLRRRDRAGGIRIWPCPPAGMAFAVGPGAVTVSIPDARGRAQSTLTMENFVSLYRKGRP